MSNQMKAALIVWGLAAGLHCTPLLAQTVPADRGTADNEVRANYDQAMELLKVIIGRDGRSPWLEQRSQQQAAEDEAFLAAIDRWLESVPPPPEPKVRQPEFHELGDGELDGELDGKLARELGDTELAEGEPAVVDDDSTASAVQQASATEPPQATNQNATPAATTEYREPVPPEAAAGDDGDDEPVAPADHHGVETPSAAETAPSQQVEFRSRAEILGEIRTVQRRLELLIAELALAD